MSDRKRDDSHYKQYALFADRLAHLDEDGWDRLRANCADLNSTSFSALVARARLRAKSQSMIYPDTLKNLPVVKATTFAARVFVNTLYFGYEVLSEFSPGPDVWASTEKSATGKPHIDMAVDAARDINQALVTHARTEPGTLAAVNAAAHAVLHQPMLDPRTIAEVYAYVEPVIPFASLTPAA